MADDWTKHGPGTCEWDVMFGTNHTGLFPTAEMIFPNCDEGCMEKWAVSHVGGGKYKAEKLYEHYVQMLIEIDAQNGEYLYWDDTDDEGNRTDKITWYQTEKNPNFDYRIAGEDRQAVRITEIDAPSDEEIRSLYDEEDARFYFWKRDGN